MGDTRTPQGGYEDARSSVPSSVAPDPDTPFRRPSSDETLGDGSTQRTTQAWAPTPTLTDRRLLADPAFIVDEPDSAGARVVEGLRRLGRPAELVTGPGPGGLPGRPDGTTSHPILVHVGSLSAVSGPFARTVARTVGAYRGGATITYDPALSHDAAETAEDVRDRVEDLVARADVVTVSTRDLEWLYPGQEHRAVVGRWLSSGPGIVVVSAGADGAWAMNAVGVVATSSGATVDDGADGVGEAFTAGVLDALWKGGLLGVLARPDLRTLVSGSLRELVDNATAAATIAGSSGGRPPTREELDAARGVPQIARARAD
ncbi:PfkB family carbohydrate kinase [Georgenia sp. H159]|uniref:PfkB family carbohydrate kinase n=1 Tax=Georgenia sp. H159 TaxID=3076115 RepID=UPI002D7A235E|nr:PfkB family carbohydrate kinase [Georgenia sp. H159]